MHWGDQRWRGVWANAKSQAAKTTITRIEVDCSAREQHVLAVSRRNSTPRYFLANKLSFLELPETANTWLGGRHFNYGHWWSCSYNNSNTSYIFYNHWWHQTMLFHTHTHTHTNTYIHARACTHPHTLWSKCSLWYSKQNEDLLSCMSESLNVHKRSVLCDASSTSAANIWN